MSSLTGSNLNIPPGDNEIEVSVFGPGFGECILVHYGNKKWAVLDSCIDVSNGNPAALTYLNQLDLDLSECVKLVMATHWHDDHIRGLSQVVRLSPNARFVCSGSIAKKHFISLTKAYSRNILENKKGVEEFDRILEILNERKILPIIASQDKNLHEDNLSVRGESVRVSFFSLSPSDYAIAAAQVQIAKLMELNKEPMRSLLPLDPNHASVVVLIEIKDKRILLGSDLQERRSGKKANEASGWSVIVNSSNCARNKKSSVFKIPHHGSENAHNPDVWTKMLENGVQAVLTPYTRGREGGLPSAEDVNRICSLSKNAYTTSIRRAGHLRRDWTVEKTIKESGINIQEAESPIGHVRLRSKINETIWKVELFGGANLCSQ